jgi:hypothetical protein
MPHVDHSLVISSRTSPRPVGFAQLRTGALVDAAAWDSAYPEDRHVLRAYAVSALARSDLVVSHTTAAARWNLPLVGVVDSSVHCIPVTQHSNKTRGDVIRHDVALPESDITEVDGLRVTTLSRTVFDVIRMLDLRGGLACFDAAVRQVAWSEETHTIDPVEAEAFIESVRTRNARLALELVDGRAQLPGESISRLLMWELELPAPELQCKTETDAGLAYLDFAWPQLRLFGEFDGEVKLTDPEFTRGRPRELILEMQRERRLAMERATSWRGLHSQGWPPRHAK